MIENEYFRWRQEVVRVEFVVYIRIGLGELAKASAPRRVDKFPLVANFDCVPSMICELEVLEGIEEPVFDKACY
jgi:hypothetical protein